MKDLLIGCLCKARGLGKARFLGDSRLAKLGKVPQRCRACRGGVIKQSYNGVDLLKVRLCTLQSAVVPELCK